jgi:uncharacterized protein YacL
VKPWQGKTAAACSCAALRTLSVKLLPTLHMYTVIDLIIWLLITPFMPSPVSQVSTRLITFILNLITARLLTVDAYGVSLERQPCVCSFTA